MNVSIRPLKLVTVFADCTLVSATASAQIGGGIGGGGVGIGITIGGGGSGGGAAGPSGAPLPLLGGSLLGHAALVGAGFFGWRRRKNNLRD